MCSASHKVATRLKVDANQYFDFRKVGGLSENLKLLREIIIFPLLYPDIYVHFNIRVPRGVLFHGPPGTGKTLVAGALINELKNYGFVKVQFFHHKGADILDKWVGESERKLREVFEKASKRGPSIIFFDELDGLAPIRSDKNDHIHCSVVATLLALMDGLDSSHGIIVIGATNRLDHIDPALRRSGRFDRELYFPLPNIVARKEILQVHLRGWTYKPSEDFISNLADVTGGYSGSDLQALCSESVMCGVRRLYPNIYDTSSKLKINKEEIRIEECDFLTARSNIVPSTCKNCCKRRKLCGSIKPLLERQLNGILGQLNMIWPHFLTTDYKYTGDCQKYIGRVLISAERNQGLHMHVIPALLHALEHLSVQLVNVSTLTESEPKLPRQDIPSILLATQIDCWWHVMDEACKRILTSFLENLHPVSPFLIICSCEKGLPDELYHLFQENSTLVIKLQNPTMEERKQFFEPLFNRIIEVRESTECTSSFTEIGKIPNEEKEVNSVKEECAPLTNSNNRKHKNHCDLNGFLRNYRVEQRFKSKSTNKTKVFKKGLNVKLRKIRKRLCKEYDGKPHDLTTTLTEIVNNAGDALNFLPSSFIGFKHQDCKSDQTEMNFEHSCVSEHLTNHVCFNIHRLYAKLLSITENCSVSELELLYDSIKTLTCINFNDFNTLLQKIQNLLETYETQRKL